jgi:two-component system phosphate regulon response regulator OmpR
MKRERLLELTRGDDSESFDRAIDVQIHRLRRLIEADPARPRYLQTVWGSRLRLRPGRREWR